ncbi:MAG: hypothetical protein KGH63_03960, partial [Candidatus Micrarchaeota archaeon]|nr:hypothetical protein [Candidatus Micrarchaeota archaeon]
MTAQSAPSPAPLKPLVLLSGDSRILQPLRMELERSGLARAKTMRDFYPSREAPNPVVFHNAVKMANSTEDGGVFCVLHYEFSGDRARNPYFVVDTLDTSSGRDILGDVNYFMLLGPGAFANRGFARARGSQSAHPPLYEVIGQMKRTWRAIAQKTGVDDAWAAFNMAVSKYLGGTIDQPAWTFIPLDVMSSFFGPGPASRKMRGAI